MVSIYLKALKMKICANFACFLTNLVLNFADFKCNFVQMLQNGFRAHDKFLLL